MTDLKDLKELAEENLERFTVFDLQHEHAETVLELIARVEAAEESVDAKDAAIVAGANTIHELRAALEQAKAREAELLSALRELHEKAQQVHYKGAAKGEQWTHLWDALRNAVTAMGGNDNG